MKTLDFGLGYHPQPLPYPAHLSGRTNLDDILDPRMRKITKFSRRVYKTAAMRSIYDKFVSELQDYRKYLEYPDDWDERGSDSFTKDAWLFTLSFIEENLIPIFYKLPLEEDLPEIEPGANGNFFVSWETTDFRVLAKIPKSPDEIGEYYADNYKGSSSIKDILHPRTRDVGLITWLTKQIDK